MGNPYSNLIAYAAIFFMPFISGSYVAHAQPDATTFTPPDCEFMMKVVRDKNDIIITVNFSDSLVFDYVAIERKADFDNNFSQFKYLRYEDVKASGMQVRRKDDYHYPPITDVLYRLKITMPDGITRMYPPILLPAFNNRKAMGQ